MSTFVPSYIPKSLSIKSLVYIIFFFPFVMILAVSLVLFNGDDRHISILVVSIILDSFFDSFIPSILSGISVLPCIKCSVFQRVCPCLTNNNVYINLLNNFI